MWEDRSARIDHERPPFVWQQIADDLRADVESGALPAGARLPSGPELAEIYGVATSTAVKAVAHLREQGVVTTWVGKGTYVAESAPR